MVAHQRPESQTRNSRYHPLDSPWCSVPERCPRCDDALELYHAASGRPRHFLGCRSYPQCSYTADYDAVLACLLEALDMRLVSLDAQHRWMRAMLEELFERLEERVQP